MASRAANATRHLAMARKTRAPNTEQLRIADERLVPSRVSSSTIGRAVATPQSPCARRPNRDLPEALE